MRKKRRTIKITTNNDRLMKNKTSDLIPYDDGMAKYEKKIL